MVLQKLFRNWFYALLLAFTASAILPACSSNGDTGGGGDTDMSCDAGDTKEECADDIF